MRKLNTPTIYWREIPLFRILLPFLIGIYLGETQTQWTLPFEWLLTSLFVLFLLSRVSFDYAYRWIPGVGIGLYLVLFGVFWTTQFDERKQDNHFVQVGSETQVLLGQVISYPKTTGKYWKAELKILSVQTEKEILPATGNLLVYFKKKDTASIHFGDQLLLSTSIQEIPKPKNPLAFDYKKYCHFQNLHYQSFAKEKEWKIIASKQGDPVYQCAYQWQQHFIKVLQASIEQADAHAIISAMLLGYRGAISEELKLLYAETGVLHILAVSGLHVGLLSELTLWLLTLFRRNDAIWKRWQWVISLVVIWLFVLLVGCSASVVRSAIMFSFLNFGRIFRLDRHPLNSLAAAALVILLVDPYALFQVGFQFSFLAVTGIVIFFKNIYRFWIPPNRLFDKVWQLIVVGVAAQIAVLPLSVYYFHQIPSYSFIAGLIAVPVASLILYGGLLLLFMSSISWSGALLIGQLLSLLIAGQNKLLQIIQQLPNAVWQALWLESYEVVVLYGAVICLGLVFITKRLRFLKGVLVCLHLFLLGCFYNGWTTSGQLAIVIYDLPKKSTIDLLEGRVIYSLSKDTLSEKEVLYGLSNYRMAKAKEMIEVANKLETNQIFLQNQYLQIGSKKAILLDKYTKLNSTCLQPLNCNYLILQHTPSVNIQQLQQYYNFDLLIIDSSNNRRAVRQWETTCEELDIGYYNTAKEGAFVLEFEAVSNSSYQPTRSLR